MVKKKLVKRKSKKLKIKVRTIPWMFNESMTIFVKTQVEGIHYWPEAPKDKLLNVGFLRTPHRHMFHVKVSLQVLSDEREFEFIIMKRWLTIVVKKILGDPPKPIEMSCEMIAKEVLKEVCHMLTEVESGQRNITCEVSEDGENGATVSMTFC
jgi:hypothetical protein